MNVKFDFRDLNYLQFVTKHIQFGWYNSYGLQTAIYSEVISCLRSGVYSELIYFMWGFVATRPPYYDIYVYLYVYICNVQRSADTSFSVLME